MKDKIRRIIINPLAFLGIMAQDTAWRVSEGIPKDAQLRGFTIDPQTMNLVLFVFHETFDLIDIQNTVSPLLPLEIRKIQ